MTARTGNWLRVIGVMMSERIVGFCRFSFWGRSDWGVYAGTKPGTAAEEKALQRSLATLYDEARLAFRFRSFERLTLASLVAQKNRDFLFVVLSSKAMPAVWRQRLRALCAGQPQIRLVFSEERDVGLALAPILDELTEGGVSSWCSSGWTTMIASRRIISTGWRRRPMPCATIAHSPFHCRAR